MEDETTTKDDTMQSDGAVTCTACNHASHKGEPCAECGCEEDV